MAHTYRDARTEILCISGLVVEYIVAIDVTRVRFPADALLFLFWPSPTFFAKKKMKKRAHPGSNQGPADLQSAALPLSYTPDNHSQIS